MIRKYLGMSKRDVATRLPSYIRGSILQTAASHTKTRTYPYNYNNPNIMLVPGLFCSPSVFNKLGAEIEDRANVFVPPPFPYRISMMCNIGPIQNSAWELQKELYHLRSEGIKEISLVGHSLGGLITLKAVAGLNIDMAPQIKKVICMGAPLNGSPITKLLGFIPACKDMQPGSDALKSITNRSLDTVIVSGKDSIVPYNYQIPFPSEDNFFDGKVFNFSDFQHMDFYVGSKAKIKKTAEFLVSCVSDT